LTVSRDVRHSGHACISIYVLILFCKLYVYNKMMFISYKCMRNVVYNSSWAVEPDNLAGKEHCAVLKMNGKLSDQDCSKTMNFICRKPESVCKCFDVIYYIIYIVSHMYDETHTDIRLILVVFII
jgi:hypothetical protein